MILTNPIWETSKIRHAPKQAFVIMPFSEKWSDYIYKDYISQVISSLDLTPKRADEMFGRNVMSDIWSGIFSSRLIVADLSSPNENVFYELGIAHTLGKPTVLLTQNIERVPFDLRNQRMIVYSDDHPGYRRLSTELPKHISSILNEPIDEVHHVRGILGGFMIKRALFRITLDPNNLANAEILDHMDIIGVRENTVLLNKQIELPGTIDVTKCSHRFTRSTTYDDHIRLTALFDDPYLQVGSEMHVAFDLRVTDGFKCGKSFIPYTIGVDSEELVFELITPASYDGFLKISEFRKPTEFDFETATPFIQNGQKVFRIKISNPSIGTVYGLRWKD